MEIILDRLLKPESPWIRGLFATYKSRDGIDDNTSRTLASVTGWDGDENDKGHRLPDSRDVTDIESSIPEESVYVDDSLQVDSGVHALYEQESPTVTATKQVPGEQTTSIPALSSGFVVVCPVLLPPVCQALTRSQERGKGVNHLAILLCKDLQCPH